MSRPSANDAPSIAPRAPRNAFDTNVGYSGQEYEIGRERVEGAKFPSGTVDPKARAKTNNEAEGETPPDNGQRASFDSKTGEVHGSGAADGADEWRDGFSKDS